MTTRVRSSIFCDFSVSTVVVGILLQLWLSSLILLMIPRKNVTSGDCQWVGRVKEKEEPVLVTDLETSYIQ